MDTLELQAEIPKDDGSLIWYDRHFVKVNGGENPKERASREAIETKKIAAKKAALELESLEELNEVKLHSWSPDYRCVPNSALRSALFSAIQEKDAVMVKDMVIHQSKSLKITYTGTRLTQSDFDVWQYCLHLLRGKNIGDKIYFVESKFIEGIGRKKSGTAYRFLQNSLDRLKANGVKIETPDYIFNRSLLDEYDYDKFTNKYYLKVNPQIGRLFSGGYTFFAWEQRKSIGLRKPMTLWLHGYINSHTSWVPHSIERIREYSGSSARDLHSFKQKLAKSLKELLELGVIRGFEFDDNNMLLIHMMPRGG